MAKIVTKRFQSQEHAITTGIILGAIHKTGQDVFGPDFKVVPDVDPEGDYQQNMLIEWGGRKFLVTVSEIVIEEPPV